MKSIMEKWNEWQFFFGKHHPDIIVDSVECDEWWYGLSFMESYATQKKTSDISQNLFVKLDPEAERQKKRVNPRRSPIFHSRCYLKQGFLSLSSYKALYCILFQISVIKNT